MNTDSITLYKLMIMYMLNKVNFPLSNSQISEFMLENQFTNYFTLQEVINSLVSDGFLSVVTYRNSTQYKLTSEGTETIGFFYTKISQSIRDDIDNYINNMRKSSLKIMAKLSDNPDSSVYLFAKKIFQLADKAHEDEKEGKDINGQPKQPQQQNNI